MARSFNGSNQYLRHAAAIDISASGLPFSMACWFRVVDVANSYALMTISRSATNDDFVTIQSRGTEAGDPVYVIYEESLAGETSGRVGTSTSVVANTWSHACGVFTSTTSRSVYLNGAGKQTNTTLAQPAGGQDQTVIGALQRTSIIQYANGNIAFPCIWNIALSDDEVSSLATGLHPSLVRPEAIVSLWDLTGGGSPEPDLFGGYDLTLTNAPTVTDNPRIIMPRRSRLIMPVAAAGGTAVPVFAHHYRTLARS